jgi:hypothetical protein
MLDSALKHLLHHSATVRAVGCGADHERALAHFPCEPSPDPIRELVNSRKEMCTSYTRLLARSNGIAKRLPTLIVSLAMA